MYEIVSIATNIFDVLVTFMFFDDLLSWKDINTYKKFLLGCFMFTATIVNNIVISNQILTIATSVVILVIVSFAFKGKLSKKILIVIGYMLLVIIADILVTLIAVQFFDTDVNSLLNVKSNARMINTIISKPILLLLLRIVAIFAKKETFRIYRSCGVALLTIPIVNIALIISIVKFIDYINIQNITPHIFCIAMHTL